MRVEAMDCAHCGNSLPDCPSEWAVVIAGGEEVRLCRPVWPYRPDRFRLVTRERQLLGEMKWGSRK